MPVSRRNSKSKTRNKAFPEKISDERPTFSGAYS
jgi:hypothetical protein